MTPKERAAMQQALSTDEALMALELILRDGIEHGNWPLNKNCEDGLEAITALREALAEQVEQEPVATVVDESEEQTNTMSWILSLPLPVGTKLYAAPVRTKDLTDDEIDAFIDRAWDKQMSMPEIIRAVIAADREKNK